MTLLSSVRRNIGLVALFSLLLALLPFGPSVTVASASTGALTVPSSGGETAPSANWSYDASTGVLSVTGTASIAASYLSDRLEDRNLTIQAASITIDGNVVATTGSSSLTLSTTGDIDVKPARSLTTQGGSISLHADSDGDGFGGIRIGLEGSTDATILTNGGNLVLGGGDGSPNAAGISAFSNRGYFYSIGVESAILDAGGGNVEIRGSGGGTTNAVWCVQLIDTIKTSVSGSITVNGDCGTLGAGPTGAIGVAFIGTLETFSGAITVTGSSSVVRAGVYGISGGGTAKSVSGPILLRDSTADSSNSNYFGVNLFNAVLGDSAGGSSSNVTIEADKFLYFPNVYSAGTLSLVPAGSTFQSAITIPNTVTFSNLTGMTIGAAGNTQNIVINEPFSVAGTLTIHSNGAVSQGAAVTATSLSLNGSGSFTLTNTSNNFGTIAGGASGSKLGSVSVYDASGGLTIGTVGSLEGITATGDVLVETGAGDITLAKNIATDSTASSAITLNAGDSTSAGTSTGGNIVVSGSPTLTTGANGIVRLFSGSESGSTGLTTLAGGASNVYYGVDENSTLSPSLSPGSSYALYRQKPPPPVDSTYDLYVQPGNFDVGHPTKDEQNLVLKNAQSSTSPATGYRLNRVSYIRFDYDPDFTWTSAALEMVVSQNNDGAPPGTPAWGNQYTTFNVQVWGMADTSWDNNLSFTAADDSTEAWGINTSTWPWSTVGGTFLGTISIPTDSDTVGDTYSLSTAELVSFLNGDSDGAVTLYIQRNEIDSFGNLRFASSRNTTPGYHGPRLVVPSGSYSYTIAYDINGGTGNLPAPGTYTSGSSAYTIAAASNVTPPTGKSFAGWNSKQDGTGTAYPVGSLYSTAASLTLYAQYSSSPVVTFNSNDGSGGLSYQAVTANTSTALTANSFARSGYIFSGWNTASNGSGTSYADNANISISSSQTLYAQWTLAPSGSSGGSSGGSSASNSVATPTAPVATSRQTRLTLVGPNTNPVPRPVERLGLRFDPDAPSRATVGGAPANLVKTPLGSKDLSIAAGVFQFGVSLAEADGAEVQTDTPSQSPELFVPRGQSAAVTGQGSYPGSFVQLFLPGNGEGSRELARIPVRSDGTFASDLSFQAGALELPVPIGRQVLQVVGYDELGNQTVVDMTVNIGQGVPAPEPNREAGALPALTAGQSLATSGGIPETVSVTGVPEAGNVVVEGSGWVINVNADRDNGVVETSDGTVLVRLNPSSVGTTSGNGFLPGTLATVWLFSEPTLVATVNVNDAGEFSAEFLVDARLIAPGEHTLQVQGVGSDGYIKAANLGVLVEEPVELTTESASTMLWWVVGAFLLALVLLLFVLARRRRREA